MTVVLKDWDGDPSPGDDAGCAAVEPDYHARLIVIEGHGRGSSWQLHGWLTRIGRGAQNDVVLDFGDRTIHRDQHAAIEYDKGIYRVHDVRRGNPVYLNDRIVDDYLEAQLGDRIRVGSTTLRLEAI